MFTVYQSADAGTAHSGLSLAEAADEMLSDDGRDWELRRDGDGWRIWNTWQNHARPWTSTRFYSAEASRAGAEAELFAEITGVEINRLACMPDDEFTAMVARIDAENADVLAQADKGLPAR